MSGERVEFFFRRGIAGLALHPVQEPGQHEGDQQTARPQGCLPFPRRREMEADKVEERYRIDEGNLALQRGIARPQHDPAFVGDDFPGARITIPPDAQGGPHASSFGRKG